MHYFLADRWASNEEPGAKALLLDQEGFVNETSSANVVVVIGQRLISPRREKILHGVSLAMVEELAAKQGWVFEERDIAPADLLKAEEIFTCSTPYCMLPVVAVDGKTIGTGKPGPVFGELLGAWSKSVGLDIVQQATLLK
jgi:D-alanine transaminase/branched-chain amino acid aminotransferase